jgi:hypothetical protein
MVTDQNLIHEEVKGTLHLGRTCYQSIKNPQSLQYVSKNLKILMYRSPVLIVLYGCKTWSPIVREEHRTMIFENKVFGRILESETEELTGGMLEGLF